MSRLNVDQIYTRTGTGSPAIREMPVFRGYLSATQSISSNVNTKVNIDTKTGDGLFDTNGYFDTVNKRYVPQIAGYYQFNGTIRVSGTSITRIVSFLYKNGIPYEYGQAINPSSTSSSQHVLVSSLIYMNGTTDYVELNGTATATSPSFSTAAPTTPAASCFLEGFLVRPD